MHVTLYIVGVSPKYKFFILKVFPGRFRLPSPLRDIFATMSDCERSDLESGRTRRGGLDASAAEPGTTPPGIRYGTSIQQSPFSFRTNTRLFGKVYYLLYADDSEMSSKVAIDPEQPSLGRIRTGFFFYSAATYSHLHKTMYFES